MTREGYFIRTQAIETAMRCLRLFWWSKSEAQWAQSYASADGRWEWFFW